MLYIVSIGVNAFVHVLGVFELSRKIVKFCVTYGCLCHSLRLIRVFVIDQVTCIFVLQTTKYVCVEKNDLYAVCAIDINLYVFFKIS